jgi:hypothetical protein
MRPADRLQSRAVSRDAAIPWEGPLDAAGTEPKTLTIDKLADVPS